MTDYYRQCTLSHLDDPRTGTTCWIPEKGAVVGKHLHLTDSDDPDQVWVVESVGDQRLEGDKARELSQRWRTYMDRVDI